MSKIVKKVYVSARSIRSGVPQERDACPVALAVNKVLKKLEGFPEGHAEVDGDIIEVRSGWSDYAEVAVGKTPRQVSRFVKKFDKLGDYWKQPKRKDFKPFTFILRLNLTA